jgi:hypothetical protein
MPTVATNFGLGLALRGMGQDDDDFDFGDYLDPTSTSYMPTTAPVAPVDLSTYLNPVAPAPVVGPVVSATPSLPASTLLPSNLQTVKYADGTTGFFDPADGTYYDAGGNDVTGYVSNFGGATITGTATQAQIQAAEGISPATPGAAPKVPAVKTPSPSLLQSLTTALMSPAATMPTAAKPATAAAPAATIAGMNLGSIMMLGLAGLALVLVVGRK